jgi:hypothetical protein
MKRVEKINQNLLNGKVYEQMSASTGVSRYTIFYDPEDQVCRLATHYERHNPVSDPDRIMDLEEACDFIVAWGYHLCR